MFHFSTSIPISITNSRSISRGAFASDFDQLLSKRDTAEKESDAKKQEEAKRKKLKEINSLKGNLKDKDDTIKKIYKDFC